MNNEITRETINNQICAWTSEHIGASFEFREHQCEAICDIIYNIVNKCHHTHIIEAPTGSGKSLLCIISAGVLSQFYNKRSYILCSDLYLFGQYENFIKKNNLDYGTLKGQTGNYYCDLNGEDVRNGECRIAQVPWSKMYDAATSDGTKRIFQCAQYCTYLSARRHAQFADVTVMTYQLYFYMINVVSQNLGNKAPFSRRDVIFCDECHNIPQLIQSQYSPVIHHSDFENLIELYKHNNDIVSNSTSLFPEFDNDDEKLERLQFKNVKTLRSKLEDIWGTFVRYDDCSHTMNALQSYFNIISVFAKTVEYMETSLGTHKRHGKKISKSQLSAYKLTSWYRNHRCLISDFSTAINECGEQYLVKKKTIPNDGSEMSFSFSCAKEDYMCWEYLLSTALNNVLMSATVGMKAAFDDNIGMKYSFEKHSYMQRIPSTFDFSRSPIFIDRRYKMSYADKATSLPHIKNAIYEIVRQFKNFRGMIQTGSYDIAKNIYDNAPADVKKRLHLYINSSEKDWVIEQHCSSKDSVLIGPTLMEGIDLPDDLCRFIIIAKVPFPNLSDDLVKAKMKLFPRWYDSATSNNVIQGIGRGNRNATDWCVTYILDGCFDALLRRTKMQFSDDIVARMKFL